MLSLGSCPCIKNDNMNSFVRVASMELYTYWMSGESWKGTGGFKHRIVVTDIQQAAGGQQLSWETIHSATTVNTICIRKDLAFTFHLSFYFSKHLIHVLEFFFSKKPISEKWKYFVHMHQYPLCSKTLNGQLICLITITCQSHFICDIGNVRLCNLLL